MEMHLDSASNGSKLCKQTLRTPRHTNNRLIERIEISSKSTNHIPQLKKRD